MDPTDKKNKVESLISLYLCFLYLCSCYREPPSQAREKGLVFQRKLFLASLKETKQKKKKKRKGGGSALGNLENYKHTTLQQE